MRTGITGLQCSRCGFHAGYYRPAPHQLPLDTILGGKYLLGRVMGQGGFGITYIAWDLTLRLKVAIKEFYPSGFVTREVTNATTVRPLTGQQGRYFLKGRSHFVEEARVLARFSSMAGIVSVRDFFQENGTAYIVMEFIEGQTFKNYLQRMGGRLPALQVLEMMSPVMESLEAVHRAGMIHRDISPDNIMISHDGYMKLLDFGAARAFAESGRKTLSVMLKPGFSPEEQYRSYGEQGPWTDVYALCAVMYRAITGAMPEESTARLRQDGLVPPARLGAAMPPHQEAALLRGMAVLRENRIQTMGELIRCLEDRRSPTAAPDADAQARAKKLFLRWLQRANAARCAALLRGMAQAGESEQQISARIAGEPAHTLKSLSAPLDNQALAGMLMYGQTQSKRGALYPPNLTARPAVEQLIAFLEAELLRRNF